MKIAGIIAEWNPFHNGHAYLIRQARERYGCDYVIGVISGDFVQRGMPAIMSKYERTRAALLSGVDLVLEMPVRYAAGSAEYFAGEGVHILDSLGCVTHLFFGVEDPAGKSAGGTAASLPRLSSIADILAEEPDWYKEALQAGLKKGLSFPAAREEALRDNLPAQAQDTLSLLREPNTILALEYLKALKKSGSRIKPAAVPRMDGGYHSTHIPDFDSDMLSGTLSDRLSDDLSCMGFVSASAIRAAALDADELPAICKPYLPEVSAILLDNALQLGYTPDISKFDLLMHWTLLQTAAQEPFDVFEDVTGELAARINKLLFRYETFEQFVSLLKTRQITRTHVCRALLHIFLGIRRQAVPASGSGAPMTAYPGYVRMLGFREDASPLLSKIGRNARICMISKNADAGVLLGREDYALFRQDLHAGHLYQMLFKTGIKVESELSRSPIRA